MGTARIGFGIAVVLGVAACGGASSSDLFTNGEGTGPAPASSSTEAPPAATAPTSTGRPTDPPPTPCTAITYYKDEDGDGFGGASTKLACAPPDSGWTTKGGDCNDQNVAVFPGQSAFFIASYTSKGTPSFDYNCNGTEELGSAPRKAAAACALGVAAGTCTGTGLLPPLPPRPAGAGVDLLCGAVRLQTCLFQSGGGPAGSCVAQITNNVEPTPCH